MTANLSWRKILSWEPVNDPQELVGWLCTGANNRYNPRCYGVVLAIRTWAHNSGDILMAVAAWEYSKEEALQAFKDLQVNPNNARSVNDDRPEWPGQMGEEQRGGSLSELAVKDIEKIQYIGPITFTVQLESF